MTDLSPDHFGIAGAENMDVAPKELTCSDLVNQYCALNPELCTSSPDGLMLQGQVVQDFLSNNPQCTEHFNEPTEPITSIENQVEMENKDLFNIKSPNFLGGQNVHNVILIVLALLILVNTGGGNLLTAPLKAAKKAV